MQAPNSMSFSQYKLNYIKDRLQVIEMTSNGYLIQSCNTLIDLEPYRDRPLYKSFPKMDLLAVGQTMFPSVKEKKIFIST